MHRPQHSRRARRPTSTRHKGVDILSITRNRKLLAGAAGLMAISLSAVGCSSTGTGAGGDEQDGDIAFLTAELGAAFQCATGHVLADVATEQVS